jgi:probable addiction module antidote protein
MEGEAMNLDTASVDHEAETLRELAEDPEFAIEYLTNALSSGEQILALLALRRVAEAYGMAHIAEVARINRENLYRSLSPRGNPKMKTIMAVIQAIRQKLPAPGEQPLSACG